MNASLQRSRQAPYTSIGYVKLIVLATLFVTLTRKIEMCFCVHKHCVYMLTFAWARLIGGTMIDDDGVPFVCVLVNLPLVYQVGVMVMDNPSALMIIRTWPIWESRALAQSEMMYSAGGTFEGTRKHTERHTHTNARTKSRVRILLFVIRSTTFHSDINRKRDALQMRKWTSARARFDDGVMIAVSPSAVAIGAVVDWFILLCLWAGQRAARSTVHRAIAQKQRRRADFVWINNVYICV